MTRIVGFVTYLAFAVFTYAVPAVLNYAGQIAVNGEAFDGKGLFKFALVNADGTTTYWSNDGISVNGSEPKASVSVSVNGGLYSLLLGNTAMAGMGAIDPQVFAQHGNAKLRVWFSDGVNGFQQLSPDRPFASVPYAFSAGIAQSAVIADGSINKSMLGSDVIAELNKSVTITRAMLPQDVRDDLNKTVTITRSMLPADVLSDLNRTVSKSMLGSDVLADLNKSSSTAFPITLSMLAPEVKEKLDRNTTTTNYNAPSVGSLLTVPFGQPAPAGYSFYQQGTPKELVWQEKAPVSVARQIHNGAAVLDGMIYVVGGGDGTKRDIVEQYDPTTNTWQTLSPLSSARLSASVSPFQGKLYAMGGIDDNGDLATVEIYDPTNDSLTQGPSLPHVLNNGNSIIFNNSIYLIGGNDADSKIATNYMLEANASDWVAKAPMSVARAGQRLVILEDRIWAMGGNDSNSGQNFLNLVESYDPISDSWRTEPSLPEKKQWASAWVANGKIYIAGGRSSVDVYERSIFSFSRETGWVSAGNLPENKIAADAVVLNDKVYVIAGQTASGVYSKKVYAADLNASLAGVYDLYRKDGNAFAGTPVVQAEVADGSVTASKIASKTIGKDQISDEILKYLKPEITAQPQAQTVYEDTNVSYSVTAEGKYLTYQWKKDGVDLAGETNSTLKITDANATQDDGNYSVVVSNDFGSVESGLVELKVKNLTLMNGLVGWWKFDETNGTVAYDSSGNGNDGNLTGGPTWTTGKIGGALSFDGVDDYVRVLNPVQIKTKLSIGVFVKLLRQVGDHAIIANDGLSNNKYLLNIFGTARSGQEGYVEFGSKSLSDLWTVAESVVDNEIWYFICGTYDGSKKKIYVNNSLSIEELATGNLNPILYSTIGSLGDSRFTKGLIDDVRIYDRALSSAEVQALYNLGQ